MPRLWDDTIEAHRHAVREAALDATAALVAADGIRAVTMSKVAEETGIGRATLYKYFSDVEGVLRAWHERQIESHLDRLVALRAREPDPGRCLSMVLETYALIQHHKDSGELTAVLHRGAEVDDARDRLTSFISGLLAEAAAAGTVRDDVSPGELADYCLAALAAATTLPSKAAVRRLVDVTLTGLRGR